MPGTWWTLSGRSSAVGANRPLVVASSLTRSASVTSKAEARAASVWPATIVTPNAGSAATASGARTSALVLAAISAVCVSPGNAAVSVVKRSAGATVCVNGPTL